MKRKSTHYHTKSFFRINGTAYRYTDRHIGMYQIQTETFFIIPADLEREFKEAVTAFTDIKATRFSTMGHEIGMAIRVWTERTGTKEYRRAIEMIDDRFKDRLVGKTHLRKAVWPILEPSRFDKDGNRLSFREYMDKKKGKENG